MSEHLDKAMQAMERALSKMRQMEDQGRDGKSLKGVVAGLDCGVAGAVGRLPGCRSIHMG
jgi:hypothetical protein